MQLSINRVNQRGISLKNRLRSALIGNLTLSVFLLLLPYNQLAMVLLSPYNTNADILEIICSTIAPIFAVTSLFGIIYLTRAYHKIEISYNKITLISDIPILNRTINVKDVVRVVKIKANDSHVIETMNQYICIKGIEYKKFSTYLNKLNITEETN